MLERAVAMDLQNDNNPCDWIAPMLGPQGDIVGYMRAQLAGTSRGGGWCGRRIRLRTARTPDPTPDPTPARLPNDLEPR